MPHFMAHPASLGLISKPTYVQCNIVPSSQSCIWSPRARRRWSAQKHHLLAGRRQSSRRRSSARHTGSGRSNAAQFCQMSGCPWTTLLQQWGDAEWWSCWSDALGCLKKSMNVFIIDVLQKLWQQMRRGNTLGLICVLDSRSFYCFYNEDIVFFFLDISISVLVFLSKYLVLWRCCSVRNQKLKRE